MIKKKRIVFFKEVNLKINKNKIQETNLSFINTSKIVNALLKEDENISLNFKGFLETFNTYIISQNNDIDTLFYLTKDTLLWSEYMGTIETYFFHLIEKNINKKLYLESFKSKDIKIIEEISKLNIKIDLYKHYIRLLKNQKVAFIIAHHNLKKLYKNSFEKLKYYNVF